MAKPKEFRFLNKDEQLWKLMDQYRLRLEDVQHDHRSRTDNSKERSFLFVCDKKKDMFIYYPTLDGYLEEHNQKGTIRITRRRRLYAPFPDGEGKPVKYTMEGKNCIFFPPPMVRIYQKCLSDPAAPGIPLLIVTEGEKKALVAVRHGFDCVGISGIWNFCQKSEFDAHAQDELMPSLKEFIRVCKVQKLVLLHDSDALDISKDPKKSATDRPGGFCKAVKRFAELIFQEGVQFYYSYINPHLSAEEKLGLDDLIATHEDYNQRVLLDFITSVEEKKFTTYFCTTKIEYIKEAFIKDIFKLNDPVEFYRYHKAYLKGLQFFQFEKRTFKVIAAEDRIEEQERNNFRPIYADEGVYIAQGPNGAGKEISNFTMSVLFHLPGPNGTSKRIIEVKNTDDQSFVREFTDDMMVSVNEFKKAMISKGCFIWKGNADHLTLLNEMLLKGEKSATELSSLGWQKQNGFWAWSNGITASGRFYPINEYGIVTYNDERFYLPAYSSLFPDTEDIFENEKNFKHMDAELHFDTWIRYFTGCYGNNGFISACFYISSLFRDLIYSRDKVFPILCLFGQKGSGKSTVAKSLMCMYGHPQAAISLENASSTKKGMYRKFAQFKNGLVWLDEYKNTIHPDMIGLLKNLYDGIGYERAQMSQDNRTLSNPVHSSTILSGQDMPTADAALFTRVILLMFKNNTYTKEQVKAYNDLKALEKRGLTFVTEELLAHRPVIEANFKNVYDEYFTRFSDYFKLEDMEGRLLLNAAYTIVPAVIMMRKNLIDIGCSESELFAKFCDCMKQHKMYLQNNQEVGGFWSIIENLFDEGVLKMGTDFKFEKDALAVRFNRVYTAYAEKHRKAYGKNGIDKLTLENYLRNDSSFIDITKSLRFPCGIVTSAYLFKYKLLGINLEKDPAPDASSWPSTTEQMPEPEKPF